MPTAGELRVAAPAVHGPLRRGVAGVEGVTGEVAGHGPGAGLRCGRGRDGARVPATATAAATSRRTAASGPGGLTEERDVSGIGLPRGKAAESRHLNPHITSAAHRSSALGVSPGAATGDGGVDSGGVPARLRPADPARSPRPRPACAPAEATPADLRLLVKHYLALLQQRAPGGAVEVRVPPYAAAQVIGGTTHKRGTPPAVVEIERRDLDRLATGDWRGPRPSATGCCSPPVSGPT